MKGVTALVLVGGGSTRLGRNKALEAVGGRTLLQRVLDAVQPLADEILIVAAQGQDTSWLPSGGSVRHIVDAFPSGGPLVGVCSGLLAARSPYCIALACDMPFLSAGLLAHMAEVAPGYDAVVPRPGGRVQALHAVYARTCAGLMRSALAQGRRALYEVIGDLKVRWLEASEMERHDPAMLSCFSVNTQADLERARALADRG